MASRETSVEATSSIPADMLDESGVVQADLACRRCGYNLRGLRPDGRCPECGAAIGLSCYGDLLQFSDPGWVETLARGAALVFWGTILWVGSGLLNAGLKIVGVQTVGLPVRLLSGLVALYGAWLITVRDPGGIGDDPYVTDRRIVRAALLLGLGLSVVDLAHSAIAAAPLDVQVILGTAALLAGVFVAVGEFAQLTYFGKLCQRIPNDELASRAGSLRWVVAISLGVVYLAMGVRFIILFVALNAPPEIPGPSWEIPSWYGASQALSFMTLTASLVYVGSLIVVLLLLHKMRIAFRSLAQAARSTWAAGAAPAQQ